MSVAIIIIIITGSSTNLLCYALAVQEDLSSKYCYFSLCLCVCVRLFVFLFSEKVDFDQFHKVSSLFDATVYCCVGHSCDCDCDYSDLSKLMVKVI
jgi:hypothetical protein